MKETYRMCPNRECPKFRTPTRLLGGCECGDGLVAYAPEGTPTVREMAEFCSRVACLDPNLKNVSVEEAERELARSPESQKMIAKALLALAGAETVET